MKAKMSNMLRINVGCGRTPTAGWYNYDNSFSPILAKLPILPEILGKIGLINSAQYNYIKFARERRIMYANAVKRIPLPSDTVAVVYSSHMLEHLDREGAVKFLNEAWRVLIPGGIIRIAVPDLQKQIDAYLASGDADSFVEKTYLCSPKPKTFISILSTVFIGNRLHQWMYDGHSLSQLLLNNGFDNVAIQPKSKTRIAHHEPLDLREREDESVYVEAEKPSTTKK